MPDIDLFNFFRWTLGTVATIYATLVTVDSGLEWYRYLTQPGRVTTLLSRYLLIHALRVRMYSLAGDLLICLLLCATFLILVYAHGLLPEKIIRASDVHRTVQHAHRIG